jgi:hypothetical protein
MPCRAADYFENVSRKAAHCLYEIFPRSGQARLAILILPWQILAENLQIADRVNLKLNSTACPSA